MNICEVLGRNAAVAVLRLSTFLGCSEGDVFEFPIDLSEDKNQGSFEYKGTEWKISFDIVEVDRFSDIYDFSIGLKLIKGELKDICISLALKFHGFEENNFLFIPSAYYGSLDKEDCFNCQDIHITSESSESNIKGKYMSVDQCPTPSVGFFNPNKKRAFLLEFKHDTLQGFEGIGFRKIFDKKVCEFLLCIPFKNNSDTIQNNTVSNSYKDLISGKTLKIKSRVIFSPCEDLGDFYNIYFDTITNIYRPTHILNNKSLSYTTESLIKKININEEPCEVLQCAVKILYSMLHGDKDGMVLSVNRLDKLMSDLKFEDVSLKEEDLKRLPESGLYEIKELEASYFACKSVLYLHKVDDRLIKVELEKAVGDFTKRFLAYVDKEVISYLKDKIESSCKKSVNCLSLCIIPASLTYLGLYLDDKTLITKAEEVAEILFKITFDCKRSFRGLTDSRWAYMLLESLITIYEATAQEQWYNRAVAAGRYFSTWYAKYDSGKSGLFGNYSGNALFRLFLYTEDFRYLNILKQTLKYWTDNYHSDSFEGILSYFEAPGLYINYTEGLVAAIDSIDAKVLDRQDGRLRVVVTNPTTFGVKIRTMVDRNVDGMRMDKCFIPKYKEIFFSPGETKLLSF